MADTLAEAQLALAVAALTRLAMPEWFTEDQPGVHAYTQLAAEAEARREYAAGALGTISRLPGESPDLSPAPVPQPHVTPGLLRSLVAAWTEREDGTEAADAVMAVATPEFERLLQALVRGNRAGDPPGPEPVPPLPPGQYGRVEMPGWRSHTGWITEETRFGQAAVVVRNRDGSEDGVVFAGPGCRVMPLPVPSASAAVAAITSGPARSLAEVWGSDEDESDDDLDDPW